MPVRSDRNDWDRLPKCGVQTTFWDHHSATHKFSIFGHLSPKTESDTDQIDAMWVQGMPWGICKGHQCRSEVTTTIGIVFHLDCHKLHEKYTQWQDFTHTFHRHARSLHQLNSKFLSKVCVAAFVNLPCHVHQHTNRTKVHLNGLGRLNCVNTKLMSFQHLRSMIVKGVPRMVIGSPGLQNWTCNHVLTISYVWMHHVGSLKRAKVLLTSKVGVVTHIWLLDNMKFVSKMIKITPKWWKFVHRSHVWDTYTV